MEISFNKNQTEEGSVSVAGQTSCSPAVTPQTQAIARRDTRPSLAEVIVPRLHLVHSVGNMKDSHPVGAYVYNQELVLCTASQVNVRTQAVEKAGSAPLIVTFLDTRPVRYFEEVKGGARGLICNTEEEVRAAGGTLSFSEFELKEKEGMKKFVYACDCLLAIERPEIVADDDTVFVFPVEDKKYALAMYNMKSSAFTVLKQTVNTAKLLGCLRSGIATHSWALSSRLVPRKDGKSTYWRPVLTPAKKSTPAFLEWAASVIATPTRDSDIAE